MRPVTRTEILPLAAYEAVRDTFRAQLIEQKRARRVLLGELMSVVFENRDTVLGQIHEMLRTERITSEPAILHEIDTYNELVPGQDELSLTLFVEIGDSRDRERTLRELAGLEERVALEVDGLRRPARAAPRDGAEPDRTTAVHYLKIELGAELAERVRAGRAGHAALLVDHPRYPVRTPLEPATLRELARDLATP